MVVVGKQLRKLTSSFPANAENPGGRTKGSSPLRSSSVSQSDQIICGMRHRRQLATTTVGSSPTDRTHSQNSETRFVVRVTSSRRRLDRSRVAKFPPLTAPEHKCYIISVGQINIIPIIQPRQRFQVSRPTPSAQIANPASRRPGVALLNGPVGSRCVYSLTLALRLSTHAGRVNQGPQTLRTPRPYR